MQDTGIVLSENAAEGVTYTFSPKYLTATGDKNAITEGTLLDADGYFKTAGTVTERSNGTSVTTIEVAKAGGGAVQFTVTGKADVVVQMSSTGGSNTSAVGLVDAAGTLLENKENVTTVTGTGAATMTYEGLPAGTYKVISPADPVNGRGARVHSISVTDKPIVVTNTYTFSPKYLTATGDKNAIAEGTLLDADGYFKTTGTVTERSNGTSVTTIEVAKAGGGAVQFTVTGKADVVVQMSSTGGSNTSAVGLVDAAGTLLENKENVTTVTGTGAATMTYEGLPAGTYKVISPADPVNGRGARVHSIEVTETKGAVTEPEVSAWDKVPAPVIKSVTVNADGNFVVELEAVIDKYEGGEYVMLSMQNNGFEVANKRVTDTSASVEMIPYWSGDYTFVATLYRTGEPQKDGEPYVHEKYSLRLDKPAFRLLRSEGGGKVYVDWVDNARARDYTVLYKKTGDADFTVAADGLTRGFYRLEGLAIGAEYEIKVVVNTDETDPQTGAKVSSEYSEKITVADKMERQWYAGIVGSSIRANLTVKEADGTNHSDSYSTGHKYASSVDITNTSGSIISPTDDSGKISDDEDGFRYYFTMLDPNTENFKMTATFTVTDTSQTPDNQTGFGIIATDILPANMLGEQTITHKYVNSVSTIYYSARNKNPGLRYVTGNYSSDPSDNMTSERVNTYKTFTAAASFVVGNSYTFTLEKTDDAFVASMGDEKILLDNTSILSVQDDGSICVGVMTARKVGVDITNIKFETSESAGVAGVAKDDRVQPSTRVYSTSTVGDTNYEYIYATNVAGTLTVTAPDGTVLDPVTVEADSVARVNVSIKAGSNNITSTFEPDRSANLTSYDPIVNNTTVTCRQYSLADYLYVAADGSDEGDGTRENPLSLAAAVKHARPGQVLMLMDGTYSGLTIERSVCGTAEHYITMRPENEGGVLFQGKGITLVGSYWHIYGMYIKNTSSVGIQICGNNNIVEMCTVEGATNTGIQISRTGSATNRQGIVGRLWPSDNLVKNCESFDNCDSGRNDADGFAAKLTCGEGNKFYGCISHNNIDDGWDLYAKSTSGEIGAVTIENCVAYNNGWLTTEDTKAEGYKYGEGNGFKLGGGYLKGGHKLINSITFGNHGAGITSNSCPDCEVYDCTTYSNDTGISLGTMATMEKAWIVQGLISISTKNKSDNTPWAVQSNDNYISMGKASYNKAGDEAQTSWFESVDITVLPTRNENGTINMHGLLTLKDTAPAESGARLDLTSERAISTMPVLVPVEDPEPAADYSAVDAAIEEANKLNADDYVNFEVVEKAVAAVERELPESQQEKVDAFAGAIRDAIAALQEKEADYTAVNTALEKAEKLNAADYVSFEAVEKAVAAVEKGLPKSRQEKVDAFARAIEDAIAALEKPAPDLGLSETENIKAREGNLDEEIEKNPALKAAVEKLTGQSGATAVAVAEKMKEDIVSKAQADGQEMVRDNIVVQEITITVSHDGGTTWDTVTAEDTDILNKGVTLILPYPSGTNRNDFDFLFVTHLITIGPDAGTIKNEVFELTDEGLKLTVHSASPFAIGYKEKLSDNDDDEDEGLQETGDDKSDEKSSKPAKTGDHMGSFMWMWVIVLAAAAAGMASIPAVKVRRKK